jgi:chromosome segregation ATPase
MGLLTDIAKEIPISAVLKEKIETLEAENASLKTEVAILKDDLREAKAENKQIADEMDSFRQQPSSETLKKTLAILNSFRNTLPKHHLDLTDADEYHALLENAQRELSCNLAEFRIPDSAIKTREIAQSSSVDMFGRSSGDPYRYEKYIPSSYFQRQIDALLSFLESQSRKHLSKSSRQTA